MNINSELNLLKSQISNPNPNSNNPFYKTTITNIELPLWLAITAGVVLILASILVLCMLKFTVPKIQEYKNEQMEDYKKQVPRSKAKNYEQTGMYVPFFVKIKAFWPIFLGISLFFIGLTFLIGQNLSTL